MNRNIDRLIEIMAALRNPETGCPWDVKQNFETIAPYTIEEAYEVADAIQRGDMADLKDELGDLLLQVVFHARMAEESGDFAFNDVAGAIAEKMIRRHPHVFGDESAETPEAVKVSWEDTKARERAAKGQDESALDGVATALPALIRAEKLSKRAARVGFEWPTVDMVFRDIEEEIEEIQHEIRVDGGPDRLEDEVGDLLFCVANLARFVGVDPEKALRSTNDKFNRRFRAVEASFKQEGRALKDCSLDEMDARWDAVKRTEKQV
ncbi:nucleoside triphosphate pyrophosphohydrolase [Hwanghaeella grinnelliae]|uniref:Nucleoside triphosphate pyrophosphohydrolase n=1 Tax=Hwanghaeella grinnelliae TaxID=2500179 RepID=A0A3S3US98_9PROT|nr:nucleoside triphosphate pyrophosphohydrolase [Hwanghaeella grinnelliae]RVU39377.1 nucleoside triphosphate pyrophosphohydrolase [Hwanghaeella grinnelliae]